MATEADIPHPGSQLKEDVEGKELTSSELSDITVSEKDMVISTECNNGEREALAEKEPEERNGTHCTVSVTEDQPESGTSVCEKTGEAQEQDNGLYAEQETPFLAKTAEERTIETEDDLASAKSMGSAGIEKESANNGALDQEMSTPHQMNNENDMPSSTELENCSEIGKLGLSKDENSSETIIENDKPEYEMTVNEASDGAIMELEESAKNLEGTLKKSVETENESADFEAEGDTHGSDATEGQSISKTTEKDVKSVEDGENPIFAPESTVEDKSKGACLETNRASIEVEINNDENQTTNPIKEQASAKQLLREIERPDESAVKKEQITEEQCYTEENLINAMDSNQETIHKAMELHLTPTQGLQLTAPESPSAMDRSKVAEDLNQEFEAPPPIKALEEEKVIEKPVDLSSSESLVSEDKIIAEKIEEKDQCDDRTEIALPVATDGSVLEEANLNYELVKTLDTCSEAKGPEAVKTADTMQKDAGVDCMKADENSMMVSDLLTHEHEKTEFASLCEEKSDAIDLEVEKVPEAVSMSEGQGDEGNDESKMVGEIDTSKIEEQIRDAPEALSEQKSDGNNNIAPEQTLQAENIAMLCNEEDTENKTTIGKTEDECIKKEDTEFETNEIEEKDEGPSTFSELIDQALEADCKDEIAAGQAEKIEDQPQVLSHALPSNDENAETTTSIEETEDVCKRNEEIETSQDVCKRNEETETSEGFSEPIDQIVEATAKDENTPSPTLDAEKTEKQSQVTSSVVLSSEEDGGSKTTIVKVADGCTKQDDTEVETPFCTSIETPCVVSQTCESENNAIVDKSDADMVRFEETETLEAVSESKGTGFEDIHESDTRSTAEITDTGNLEDEIKANEKISDQGAENGTTIEKIEDGSMKKVEAEVNNIKLEEATIMLSEFLSTENANLENKVTDLDQTATEGLKITASDDPTEMNKSEVAEDLNQEIEANPPRKALEEEIEVIQKPVNLLSSEFLPTDGKIYKEKKEETEDDNKNDISQASVKEVSILGQAQINDESAKAFDTISDAETPETKKADDFSQQDAEVDSVNCEESLSAVSCLPSYEHEEADNVNSYGQKSDAIDSNVEANKFADAESESKVEVAEEIYKTDGSLTVGETDTNEIEEQIGDAPKALCEPASQGVKSESKDETIPVQTLQAEEIQEQLQVSSSDLIPKSEDGKTTSIVEKTEDECTKKDDEDVNTDENEDASKAVSKPTNQGVETTSKDENIPSPTFQGETLEEHLVGMNEIEGQKGDGLEALYKLINQGVEAASNDEIAPGSSRLTLQAEKTEEQLQVSSSTSAFNKEDDKTQATVALTEDGCERRGDTDFNTNGVEEQTMDTGDTLSEVINQGVEATGKDESVHSPTLQGETTEKHHAEPDEIEEQKGNALEALYEMINRHVEAASNDEIDPGPTQAEKTEDQLQVSSSAIAPNEEEDETQTTVAWREDGCRRRDDTDADTNGVGEQSLDASKTLSEPTNQGAEADCNHKIALYPTVEAKETEEQLQVLSSIVLSDEEHGETATEVDNLELEETPGAVSQPLSTTGESANNAIVKSDTVDVDEKSTLKAVSEPKDLGFEEIHQVVENGTEKIEGNSTRNADAEADNIKLEETTAVLSQFPATENDVVDKDNATVEKSEGNEFEVEAKCSDAVAEFELYAAAKESTKEDEHQLIEKADDSFEAGATEQPSLLNEEQRELDVSTTENEIVENESTTVEKSEGNGFNIEEATSSDAAVSRSELHGTDKESTKEDETQLNEKAADSLEAGAQNEEPREIHVSKFDQMAKMDSQNQAPEQDRRSLENDSEVNPQEYIPEAKYADFASEHEKTPASCSLEDTSKDENAIDLPPPHPTIKELSTEEGEVMKNDTSMEKITEEKEATRLSHPVSPHEETVAKTNQENGLVGSAKREDEITAESYQGEKSATSDERSDEIQREKLFGKETAALTASIVVGEKSIHIENHATDEDMVDLSTNGNNGKLVEPKILNTATPNGDEESQHLNEKPNVLSDGKDMEVPHEKTITYYEVTEDTKELEKGVEYGEEEKPGEGRQETAKRSILMDTNQSPRKKSRNILSGVGWSKVKHSIAKVKKVITGKSSHPKASSSPPS